MLLHLLRSGIGTKRTGDTSAVCPLSGGKADMPRAKPSLSLMRAALGCASRVRTPLQADARKFGPAELCTRSQSYRASEKIGLSENNRTRSALREVQRSVPKQRHTGPKRPDQWPRKTDVSWVGGGARGTGIQHSPPRNTRDPTDADDLRHALRDNGPRHGGQGEEGSQKYPSFHSIPSSLGGWSS
jgi:hypothetical protein